MGAHARTCSECHKNTARNGCVEHVAAPRAPQEQGGCMPLGLEWATGAKIYKGMAVKNGVCNVRVSAAQTRIPASPSMCIAWSARAQRRYWTRCHVTPHDRAADRHHPLFRSRRCPRTMMALGHGGSIRFCRWRHFAGSVAFFWGGAALRARVLGQATREQIWTGCCCCCHPNVAFCVCGFR